MENTNKDMKLRNDAGSADAVTADNISHLEKLAQNADAYNGKGKFISIQMESDIFRPSMHSKRQE